MSNRVGWSAFRLVLVGAIALSVGSSCRRSGGRGAPDVEPVLVYSDTFERDELGNHWSTTSDKWRIVDGVVAVDNAHNDALWLTVPLPEKVRITFEAIALSVEGDIKFEVFTDGRTHQSGYIGIFGGWDNQLNVIARLDEHGDDRLVGAAGVTVERGRTYAFTIERTDGRLRWLIDGEPFMTYDDPEPLTGPDHSHFGFNDWESPVRFDNLQVWDLGG